MRLRLTSVKRLLLLVCLVVPAVAWAVVKPVRVVALGFADVTCYRDVCIDDTARMDEASQLARDAQAFVEARVGAFGRNPRLVFCSKQACADYFGLGARSAVTVASVATVIGPGAWKPHYVRHELIHHAQSDRIGTLALLFKPRWVVEGMAYGLSDDPRTPLAEPFESQRKEFLEWHKRKGSSDLWSELKKQ